MVHATSPLRWPARAAAALTLAAALVAVLPAVTAGRAVAAAGRPVIFVVPHPDDETLGFSVMVRRHVAAGRDVHVLLLTRGTASHARDMLNGNTISSWWKVRHNPALEGYSPLDATAFGAARYRELLAALAAQGVGAGHVHEAGLQDGQVTVAQAKAAILQLADQLGPSTGLWSTSCVADVHPDHLAAGKAVYELGKEQPTRFWDRRYVIEWSNPADYALRDKAYGKAWGYPANNDERYRQINATRAYGAWQPRSGAFAIGWQSVPTMFGPMQANPRALVHRDRLVTPAP